jgi:hypothetical protein
MGMEIANPSDRNDVNLINGLLGELRDAQLSQKLSVAGGGRPPHGAFGLKFN